MKEIIEAYEKVKAGALRFDIRTQDGTKIKCYWVGDIIRIDIGVPKDKLPKMQTYE